MPLVDLVISRFPVPIYKNLRNPDTPLVPVLWKFSESHNVCFLMFKVFPQFLTHLPFRVGCSGIPWTGSKITEMKVVLGTLFDWVLWRFRIQDKGSKLVLWFLRIDSLIFETSWSRVYIYPCSYTPILTCRFQVLKKRTAQPNTGCNECEAGIQNYVKPLRGIKSCLL